MTLASGLLLAAVVLGCESHSRRTIAFIPRTTGALLWEPAHSGADAAAEATDFRIYWNAATREDDVEGQIGLIERAIQGHCQGLVIAPSHSLALISPVRQAIAHGIPTVIIGSPLAMPAGGGLYYILNDEERAGQIAAQRVGLILHGKGTVAVVGIDPAIKGIMIRARSFERSLSLQYPGIRIVDSRFGSFSRQHEQQMTDEVLKKGGGLDVIVALNWTSALEAISTIESHPGDYSAKVIAFDPESLPFVAASLDSIIMEDTRDMGDRAVLLIDERSKGRSAPNLTLFPPTLVTRENLSSEQVRRMISVDWKPNSPSEAMTTLP
jgi:ribose transport system substrate-binding protein